MFEPINPKKRTWMQEARKGLKLTNREMADKFNISYSHYNDIENGRRNPSIELSKVMAKFFNVPLEKFFNERTKFKKEG